MAHLEYEGLAPLPALRFEIDGFRDGLPPEKWYSLMYGL